MRLIGGTVDEHRDTQVLEHFLHLRRVQNHRRFNRQVTALGEQQLIIRFAVFSGKDDIAALHRSGSILHVPAVGFQTGKTDLIQTVHSIHQSHHRRGCHVHAGKGRLDDRDARIEIGRDLSSLRDQQVLTTVVHIEKLVSASIIIDVYALDILEIHLLFKGQTIQFRDMFLPDLCAFRSSFCNGLFCSGNLCRDFPGGRLISRSSCCQRHQKDQQKRRKHSVLFHHGFSTSSFSGSEAASFCGFSCAPRSFADPSSPFSASLAA